jgi:lipopolysaccharide transport system permease protein
MRTFNTSPGALVWSLISNRALVLDLAKRDAIGRYKGSALGIIWSLLTPLLMLAVYTFVFSEVFKARWGGGSGTRSEFAIVLFAGMIVFNVFGECVMKAPGLILGNANFVKKIVFPLDILPVVNLLSALFHALISISVLLLFQLVERGGVPLTAFFIPFVFLPLGLFTLGITWWLAATGVFLRDIGQTIGIFITALMFLSPIFFPVSSLPSRWQTVAKFNPMTFPIEQARDLLIWGNPIHWGAWLAYTCAAALVAWLGYVWFQRTRRGFADVI